MNKKDIEKQIKTLKHKERISNLKITGVALITTSIVLAGTLRLTAPKTQYKYEKVSTTNNNVTTDYLYLYDNSISNTITLYDKWKKTDTGYERIYLNKNINDFTKEEIDAVLNSNQDVIKFILDLNDNDCLKEYQNNISNEELNKDSFVKVTEYELIGNKTIKETINNGELSTKAFVIFLELSLILLGTMGKAITDNEPVNKKIKSLKKELVNN